MRIILSTYNQQVIMENWFPRIKSMTPRDQCINSSSIYGDENIFCPLAYLASHLGQLQDHKVEGWDLRVYCKVTLWQPVSCEEYLKEPSLSNFKEGSRLT